MKYGYKIFLMAFVLIIISTTTIGISLINNSFNTNINNEIEKNIIEINNIMNSINLDLGSLTYILDNYRFNNTYTKIYLDKDVVFTNFKDNNNEIEAKISKNLNEEIITYIKDAKLYMTYKKNYIVITCSDITDIYNAKDEQIKFFTQISSIASLVVALLLSILVNFMTKKIKKLNSSIKEIEKGDYEVIIPDLGKDEIGNFSRSIKSMTESINKNIKEIERISENRKIFIGNLTHELRTPLTSIIGYSSLIKNGKTNKMEIIKDYNEKIYEEGKYIEGLRDKLMNLLLLENTKIVLKSNNISELLEKYKEELNVIYKEAKLILNIAPNIYKSIDEVLFKSLIFNLIKNGIEASVKPVIIIELNNEHISIKDNGHGIPKEEIKKIKEPFYTLNKDRNRKNSGMGLGIPLCLEIIKLHKWDLDIESKLNEGATFIIRIGR